jgi:hypothetical protein
MGHWKVMADDATNSWITAENCEQSDTWDRADGPLSTPVVPAGATSLETS